MDNTHLPHVQKCVCVLCVDSIYTLCVLTNTHMHIYTQPVHAPQAVSLTFHLCVRDPKHRNMVELGASCIRSITGEGS